MELIDIPIDKMNEEDKSSGSYLVSSEDSKSDFKKKKQKNETFPIFNPYTGDVEDLERGKETMFSDGKRKIDYVLFWEEEKNVSMETNQRKIYEENLIKKGLHLELYFEEGMNERYTLVHAPLDLLLYHCESLKIRMPIEEAPNNGQLLSNVWDIFNELINKLFKNFEISNSYLPKFQKNYSYPYEKNKNYLFCSKNNIKNLISNSTRIRIVDQILRATPFLPIQSNSSYYPNQTSSSNSSITNSFINSFINEFETTSEFGIKRLLKEDVYKEAYPLHEGSWKPDSGMSLRKLLFLHWGKWSSISKVQPLHYIKTYFGEKIGLYFAWLGHYSYSLALPSLIGLFVFLYGIFSSFNSEISNQSCDVTTPYVMCPLCNEYCEFWTLDQMCIYLKITQVFDNYSTVFFAIFMSFWAAIYLEMWKREEFIIQFNWDMQDLKPEEEHPRPEYFQMLSKSKYEKIDENSNKTVKFFPYWRRQVPVFLASFSIVFFMIILAILAVVGIIFYRISLYSALYFAENSLPYEKANLIVSVSAAFINLIIIFILNFVYDKLAYFLTDWENPKTQTEYENSLTLKFYLFQFINYYSSLFYIAFFKGRLGSEDNYYIMSIGTNRQEECQGSCLTELCIQLAIIFIGKQIQNTFIEILIPRINIFKKKIFKKINKKNIKKKLKPWQEDNLLENLGSIGLFSEYLEMTIQFGFVTLFVAAFPLAPLLALLNNVIELRMDSNKFLSLYKRPCPSRASTIGIWLEILHSISRLSILTNGLIIAFTSSFIHRLVYIYVYSPDGSMDGFVNHTLSYFNISDYPSLRVSISKLNGTNYCRYHDYREPPWSERKYKYSPKYWHVLAAQFIFVLVFENFVVLIVSFIDYLVPDIPLKLKKEMKKETTLVRELVLRTEIKRAQGSGHEVLDDLERRGVKRLTDYDWD